MMTMTKMITIMMLMVTLVLTMKRRKISATLRLSSPVISGDDALQMNKKELWLRVLPSQYLLHVFSAPDSDLRLLKALLL